MNLRRSEREALSYIRECRLSGRGQFWKGRRGLLHRLVARGLVEWRPHPRTGCRVINQASLGAWYAVDF